MRQQEDVPRESAADFVGELHGQRMSENGDRGGAEE
jgi:hypothetical protein